MDSDSIINWNLNEARKFDSNKKNKKRLGNMTYNISKFKDVSVYFTEGGHLPIILPLSSEAVGPIPYIVGSHNNAYRKT